jgi:hypothetical protein
MVMSIPELTARARLAYKGPKFSLDPDQYEQLPIRSATPRDTSWVNVPPPAPMPVMFEQAQRPQEDSGWAGELGAALGGGLLSSLLNRHRSRSSDGHQSAPHSDQPIVVPHEASVVQPHTASGGAAPREHIAGFAHGGIIYDHQVGQKFKFAEREPELLMDEAGRTQLLSEPTTGAPTRAAVVIPLSKLRAAVEQAGQTMPSFDYQGLYAGPKPPSADAPEPQPSPPAYNGPQPPAVDLSTPEARLSHIVSTPDVNAIFAGGASKGNSNSNAFASLANPDARSSGGFKASEGGPHLAASRDDIVAANSFASPDVRAAVAPKSGYGAPSGLGYKGPRPPTDDFSTASTTRRLSPVDSPQQQSPTGGDVGSVPVNQRQDAIFSSGEESATASTSQPSTATAAQQPVSRQRARLEQELTTLYGLEGEKVKDKNGRVKSGLLNALRGFLQGFSQTRSLAGGIGGAISGGVMGAWHSDWDEQMKHVAKVSEQQDKVSQALAIEKELANLDHLQAQTEEMGAQAWAKRHPKPPAPIMKQIGKRWAKIDPDTNTFSFVTGEDGQIPPPDAGAPTRMQIIAEDGVTKYWMTWDPQAKNPRRASGYGAWVPEMVGEKPAVSGYVEPVISSGQYKGQKPSQVAANVSREKAASLMAGFRQQQLDIERDRNRLNQEQFQQSFKLRVIGLAKQLGIAEIDEGMSPDDVVQLMKVIQDKINQK